MSNGKIEISNSTEISLDHYHESPGLMNDFHNEYNEKEWRRIRKLKKR